jgi:hypothetical protein
MSAKDKTSYYLLDIDYLIVDLSYVIQEEEAHLMRLVSILRELLLCYGLTNDKQIELRK